MDFWDSKRDRKTLKILFWRLNWNTLTIAYIQLLRVPYHRMGVYPPISHTGAVVLTNPPPPTHTYTVLMAHPSTCTRAVVMTHPPLFIRSVMTSPSSHTCTMVMVYPYLGCIYLSALVMAHPTATNTNERVWVDWWVLICYHCTCMGQSIPLYLHKSIIPYVYRCMEGQLLYVLGWLLSSTQNI